MAWRVSILALLAAALVAMVGACGIGGGCPCGAEPSLPVGQHDLAFAGQHVVYDECICQCGEGEVFGMPRDRLCREYQGTCEDSDGSLQSLVCY